MENYWGALENIRGRWRVNLFQVKVYAVLNHLYTVYLQIIFTAEVFVQVNIRGRKRLAGVGNHLTKNNGNLCEGPIKRIEL